MLKCNSISQQTKGLPKVDFPPLYVHQGKDKFCYPKMPVPFKDPPYYPMQGKS